MTDDIEPFAYSLQTFNLVPHVPSNKTQVISSGLSGCSFNHLILVMELTAPSV